MWKILKCWEGSEGFDSKLSESSLNKLEICGICGKVHRDRFLGLKSGDPHIHFSMVLNHEREGVHVFAPMYSYIRPRWVRVSDDSVCLDPEYHIEVEHTICAHHLTLDDPRYLSGLYSFLFDPLSKRSTQNLNIGCTFKEDYSLDDTHDSPSLGLALSKLDYHFEHVRATSILLSLLRLQARAKVYLPVRGSGVVLQVDAFQELSRGEHKNFEPGLGAYHELTEPLVFINKRGGTA